MLHLTAERLAALADEQPNEIEAAHIAACPRCCHERDAQLLLLELARREADRSASPLTTWAGIEAAMADARVDPGAAPRRSRGGSAAGAPVHHRFAGVMVAARRAVAAVALLGTGLAAGRYSAGVPALALNERVVVDTVRVPAAAADAPATFANQADALAALTRAERQYQLAMTFLAAHDPGAEPLADSSSVYRARLAALDGVMAATRTALYEAPQDPVINRYYLATLGARELTVRQLDTALPAGQSVSAF